jgi:REP element-mobilizing transposase RayT
MEPTSTPQRKGIRYDGYDYRRSGAYFVTICATKGQSIFGKVIDGMISQSPLGEIAHHCWTELPTHFSYIALDSFVIMPNHVHGLLWLHPLSTQVGTVSVQIDTDAAARTDAIHGVLSPSPSESNRNSDHLDTSSLKGDPPRRFGPPIAGSLSTIISTYKAAVTRQARHNGL